MPIEFKSDDKGYDMGCSLSISELSGMVHIQMGDSQGAYGIVLNYDSAKCFSEQLNLVIKNITPPITKIGKPSF